VTERDTAAILLELRRVGVDVANVPDALAATGFRAPTLLAWLGDVPTESGTDELLRLLNDHATFALATSEHAIDSKRVLPEFDESLPRQWWPTAEMLQAAIDVLVNEWDPVGIRLGSVPAEDFGEYAFNFLRPLLDPWRRDDRLTSLAETIGVVEQHLLGLRRSPATHRRYLAARLCEVVVLYPPSQQPFRRPQRSWAFSIVSPADQPAAPPPLDPEGVCVRCGTFGTVARVTFQSYPPKTTRFCSACWAEVRQEYMSADRGVPIRPNDEAPPTSASSRSWDDAVDFLRLVITARNDPERGKDITPELLRELASELEADADKMDGPMPDEVEAFIRDYAGRT
jgi:hypothetical protein